MMRQWQQQMRRILMLLLVCLPVIAPVNSQTGNRSDSRATDCALVTGITQAECQTLVDMYNGMDGPNWTNDTNWLVDNAPCAWFGVTCSGGHVHKLDLRDNKLKNNIPASIGNLTSLTELYLLDNEQINGNLPASISSLAQLQVLLLQNNKLSGSIPSSLSTLPLVRLNLSINNFTGGIPIQLGSLTNIQILNLSDNLLANTIPTSLGNLSTLQRLYLSGNQLTGSIPSTLGSLTNLIELDLTDNKLTGTIPASLNSLTNLIRFEVGKNLLSGTIPDLSNLTNLQWFYLNFNNFTGPLPSWIGNFDDLKWFYINNNQFTGGIPAEFGNLGSILDMNLGGNSLTGTIPDSLGNLTTLKNFVVGSNKLTGGFPATMIGINLTTLHIGYNLIDETDPAVVAYLDVEDIDWDETQTISPDDVSATVNDSNLTVNWTPILYTGDGGNYIVHCSDGATDLTVNTVDKTASEVVFSGLPAGNYTCSVQTFTPAHPNNFNDLLSGEVDDSVVNPPPANQPPNDLFDNPIKFDGYPRQNYSFNIANATTNTDPVPPENDPGCAVDLPEDAAGVHYLVEGDAPGLGGVGDQGLVMHVGGPGWFSRAPAADTAIVVYELNIDGSLGAIVACADDNAPGEVSVSNAKFDLDTTKDYQVVVWNEGAAPEGAIIEMGLASFDLVSPPDSTIFTQPAEPTSFTWQAYGDEGTVYYFDIARTSDAQLPSVRLNELMPASDDDGLLCDETLCTLTIQGGSTLDVFLGNNGNPGNYIWSVAAKVPDPNNGNSTVVRDSNQIFRLVIAADGSVTPTPTEPAPTDTPTPTGTQPTSTPTPTGTLPTETPTPTATEDTGLDLLVNGGFEIDVEGDKIPDGWTLKNPSGDKLKCNKPDKVISHGGECAFQFKGVVGEQASLEQNINGSAASVGDTVTVGLWLTTKNILSGAKFSLKIKYTTADTGKLKITLPDGTQATYIEMVNSSTVLLDTVSQFKLKIKNQSTGGKLTLDDLSLAVEPSSGLIPVPAAGLTGGK